MKPDPSRLRPPTGAATGAAEGATVLPPSLGYRSRLIPPDAAMSHRIFLVLLASANAALALAAWTRQPWANGPAEWRWEYSAGGLDLRGPAALVVATALGGLGLAWGHHRLAGWRGGPLFAVGCGAAFTLALTVAQPGGLARVTAALVSRNSFGYVWDAALAPATGALLADYPAASAGLNQHSLTHPPGPLLAVRALGWLDRLLPPPAPCPPATLATGGGRNGGGGGGCSSLPALATAAIDRELQRARSHGRPVPQPPPGPWVVTVLALLLPALSALAAWPLYRLARIWGQGPETAMLAAVLWLLVPARSLFTPSFDQALPALLVGAACLAAAGGRLRAAAAGLLLFAACFLSYGCLPALPLVAACAVAAPGRGARHAPGDETGGEAETSPDWLRWSALAAGFALPYLALAVGAGHDPWHALRTALELHHRIAVEPRSYLTWLLWNPYDFALLLSPAVLILAVATISRPPRTTPRLKAALAMPRERLAAWTWCTLLVLLLLSGGVRGEAGRIWLIWMPFACLFAAAAASGAGGAGSAGTAASAAKDGAGAQKPAARRDAAVALVLASEAALTLALAARMVFVN